LILTVTKNISGAGAGSARETTAKNRITSSTATWIETGGLSSPLNAHALK